MATEVVTETEQHSAPETKDSKKRKTQIEEIEVDLSLPEPPSKKTKRLLKKGKPLPEKPKSDDEAESEDELPIPKGAPKGGKGDKKTQRSEHGIWIGNLPFTLTRVELFKWLVESSGGMIKEDNITRVNLPTSKYTGDRRYGNSEDTPKTQNKGFAYVDFNAEPAFVAAMALTETELNGRKVLIKNSNSYEGRPSKQPENGAAAATTANGQAADKAAISTSRKVYVGNLSFQTTEDDLRAHFDKCGEIEWVKVATFEDSGKCKGFGWVKFKEPEAAGWAVKGFVKIREEIETEDDFRDGEEEEGKEGGDAQQQQQQEGGQEEKKLFKMRKWWVNRLRGRELKIEAAEDDHVRYKKRFGKDKNAQGDGGKRERPQGARRESRPARRSDGETDDGKKEGGGAFGEKNIEKTAKPAYGDAGVATYLTGAVVKPQGKKITFD
ncbi:RNA-binding domain-containing protein [Daldinia caldariorum]|uniref:RNA-binding domain-containing protein n=1 Tax=Daldinia caldariorum TaxID=326644 RepID=UPI0020082AF6|nr:RNA-binding domain-containing protein [Daldinia caldariorum]KAI1466176.1 RNA-binding domain-containing protein [Daldinia caldariorum]